MLNNYKIVVVTPAGRKRYMEILLEYLLLEKDIIDEYRIWVNTINSEDLKYFQELEKRYKGFITLDTRHTETGNVGDNLNIHRFFDTCIEDDTVYIRLDDDVVWLQPNFIKNLSQYRIQNPEPPLVFGTILNNGVIDSVLQNLGLYSGFEKFNYDCTNTVAFNSPEICEKKHRYLIKEYLDKCTVPKKLFDTWYLQQYERVSINCISWLGSTFKEFEGKVGIDEEPWLSQQYPESIRKPNVVYGEAYCVHYAFSPQRPHLDNTTVLEVYKELAKYAAVNPKDINFDTVTFNNLPGPVKLNIYKILKSNNIIK